MCPLPRPAPASPLALVVGLTLGAVLALGAAPVARADGADPAFAFRLPFVVLPTTAGNIHDTALGDVDDDGHLDLLVLSGFGSDTQLALHRGRGTGWFEPPVAVAGPAGATRLRVADLDGDGDGDAVLGAATTLFAQTFDGSGAGFGEPATLWSLAADLEDLETGEVTGGGGPEVVVATADDRLLVLTAAGGALAPLDELVTGAGLRDVDLADVDGDGLDDLVAALLLDGTVSAWLSRGGGVFDPPVVSPTVVADPAATLALAHLDGDDHLDLVAGRNVSTGDGTGAFTGATGLAFTSDPLDLALLDVDGDGLTDVLSADGGAPTVATNLGGLAFASSTLVGEAQAFGFAGGDLDGDGHGDVVVTDDRRLLPLVRLEAGGFDAADGVPGELPNRSEARLGDVDGDGVLDLVTRHNLARLGWRPGLGDGTFGDLLLTSTNQNVIDHIEVTDLDGDGRADVLTGSRNTNAVIPDKLGVFLGQPDGTFVRSFNDNVPADEFHDGIGVADLDGDGLPDALHLLRGLTPGTGLLRTFRNLGGGSFTEVQTIVLADEVEAWAVGELDGDGLPDLVLGYGGSPHAFELRRGTGGGQLGAPTPFHGPPFQFFGVSSLRLVDMNGNGTLDLVHGGPEELRVHHGLGTGLFQAPDIHRFSGSYNRMTLDDLDGDGDQDVLFTGADQLTLLWNQGVTFTESAHPTLVWMEMSDTGDLDGDGFVDIVAVDTSGSPSEFDTVVLLNRLESGWTDLGGGVAGALGVPALTGTGPLFPGSAAAIRLDGVLPATAMLGLASFTSAPTPFYGGTLHANPPLVSLLFFSGAAGALETGLTWPAEFTSGVEVFVQFAAVDGAAPFGVALSNGLVGRTP